MFDFVCIGNALIDSFIDIPEDNNSIRFDVNTKELRIKQGEKIPLKSAQFELGGNACNVSVGLSRLGLKTSLIAEIGDDAFSNRIKTSLLEEKVDLSHFVISHAPASFAVGINYKSDRILFVHHVVRAHNFKYSGINAKWIYLSSIGEKWRHVYRDVLGFAKLNKIKIAFNPGTRQINEDSKVVNSVLEYTDVLFLNKEEAEKLVKNNIRHKYLRSHKEEIKALSQKLQEMGSKVIVITDGSKGSYVSDADGNFFHQQIVDTKVVEKTGAGDAFASGFLSAIFYDCDIKTALIWGTLSSASVIGKIGAQKGLLTKIQIEKMAKTFEQ